MQQCAGLCLQQHAGSRQQNSFGLGQHKKVLSCSKDHLRLSTRRPCGRCKSLLSTSASALGQDAMGGNSTALALDRSEGIKLQQELIALLQMAPSGDSDVHLVSVLFVFLFNTNQDALPLPYCCKAGLSCIVRRSYCPCSSTGKASISPLTYIG